MDRDERIEWARRRGAERAAERAERERAEAEDRAGRLAEMDAEELRGEAWRVTSSGEVEALGPLKTPPEWDRARDAARLTTIEAAKSGRTITYNELRMAAFEATGMAVGHSMFGRLCAEINRPDADGCMLSAIVVAGDTGKPGEGFEEFAARQGFTEPLTTLQRQVFERFAPD